jgi:hypothetical protein
MKRRRVPPVLPPRATTSPEREKLDMKTTASLALAAALALTGATAASARHMSGHAAQAAAASDTLNLSDDQQKSLWNDVSRRATSQNPPSDFNAAAGSEIPSGLNTYPMPRKAARDVPAVRPYRYAMTQDKLLLVNPTDNRIANVVSKP